VYPRPGCPAEQPPFADTSAGDVDVVCLVLGSRATIPPPFIEWLQESVCLLQCLSPQAAFTAVNVRTSQNIFEGSTGCHEWDAGFSLAEVLLSNPGLVSGKRCLELGSVRSEHLDAAKRRLLALLIPSLLSLSKTSEPGDAFLSPVGCWACRSVPCGTRPLLDCSD
jgi:hypothetical protein